MATARMVYPGNGDAARLQLILTGNEIQQLQAGEKITIETYIGATPEDELPANVEIGQPFVFEAEAA